MKKVLNMLLAAFIVLASTSLAAQENQLKNIDFELSPDGSFYRKDSDNNYYVLNYPGKDAIELQNWIESFVKKYGNTPIYLFDCSPISYKDGLIQSIATIPYKGDGVLDHAEVSIGFKLDYKDGRMRVNPPKILFNNKPLGNRFDETWRKYFKDTGNSFIYLFLAYATALEDYDENDDIINYKKSAKSLPSDYEELFVLNENGTFLSSEGKGYAVFNVPNMDKRTLQKLLTNEKVIRPQHLSSVGLPVDYSLKYRESWNLVECQNTKRVGPITMMDAIIHSKYDISVVYAYEIHDELIVVFAPKITGIIERGEEEQVMGIYSMGGLMSARGLRKKSGDTYSLNSKKQKDINDINSQINNMVYSPVLFLSTYIREQEQKERDANW